MYRKELELAKQAAAKAGAFLRKREKIQIQDMSGKDMKLSSDKNSEKIIRDILSQSGLPMLAEENGASGELENCFWVIDPLDGTVNYFKEITELSCVSIALWADGEPVLGVVYRFTEDELFWGAKGEGAWLNEASIFPSLVQSVSQAVLATGFPVKRSYDTESLEQFVKKVQAFKKVRMLGAAAIMGVFVACGRVDAYMEEEIMLWDVSAAAAIVNAAGGCTHIEILEDNKCICRCFANQKLLEDYHAKGL